MIVLVCGGRGYDNKEKLVAVLDWIKPTFIIEGGADGADCLASIYAAENGIPWATVPANWRFYGKKAGALRNESMLRLKPDKVVAFPGKRGTAHMVRVAKEQGFEVIEID